MTESGVVGLNELQEMLAPNYRADWVDDMLVLWRAGEEPSDGMFLRFGRPEPIPIGKPEQTCVIVAGVPRSGTSAVAGVLHYLGVEMGPYGGTINDANPMGYFENSELVNFHQNVTGPGTKKAWRNLDRIYRMDDEALESYRDVFGKLEGQAVLWGFKDLRWYGFCEHVAEIIESRIKVVEVVRRLDAIRRSMLAYPGFEQEHEGEVDEIIVRWHRLKSRALDVLTSWRGASRLVVSYEALVDDPELVVMEIAGFVGVEPTQAAVGFVDPGLNRRG